MDYPREVRECPRHVKTKHVASNFGETTAANSATSPRICVSSCSVPIGARDWWNESVVREVSTICVSSNVESSQGRQTKKARGWFAARPCCDLPVLAVRSPDAHGTPASVRGTTKPPKRSLMCARAGKRGALSGGWPLTPHAVSSCVSTRSAQEGALRTQEPHTSDAGVRRTDPRCGCRHPLRAAEAPAATCTGSPTWGHT